MERKNWTKQDIVVKFEHLNPALQEIIGSRILNVEVMGGGGILELDFASIKGGRAIRAFQDSISLFSLSSMAYSIKRGHVSDARFLAGTSLTSLAARTFVAKRIQKNTSIL